MVNIHFSEPVAALEVVPLARACGIGRQHAVEPAFEKLFAAAPSAWKAVRAEEANLFVWSSRYDGSDAAQEFARRAQKAGVPCLFFDSSDDRIVPRAVHGTLYRCSLDRGAARPNESILPAPCEDMLRYRGGTLSVRPRRRKPVVGFCGYVSPVWKEWARAFSGGREKAIGHLLRRKAISALKRSRRLETSFVLRSRYFGGSVPTHASEEGVRRVREEFADNLFGSDYVLCVRGAGNFSVRFYEALSAGRIPVLVDTRCVLPLAGEIDWRRHCVIVPEADLAAIGETVADFHDAVSPSSFEQLQAANRRLWEERLEPANFLAWAVRQALEPLRRALTFGQTGAA